jgi:hypothetical protein
LEALVLPGMAVAIVILILITARFVWRDHARDRKAEELEKSKASAADRADQ